ncbi:hypothetical protein [Spongiactinospora gelatinilytica]|uniref:hypothetical protein n=1 Tax=Spongiactinospora gelatinilytica TaxID=2666298 RepID=UPI0018F4362C|nr:hypothetical protein [Spongiactinospora gelatinilytica]
MIAVVMAAVPAAHPLGDFSVNHFDGLTVRPDRIEDVAIVDSAEIPTLQRSVPGDHGRYARGACARLRDDIRAEVDGRALAWQVAGASFAYQPGAAGLRTSKADLPPDRSAADRPASHADLRQRPRDRGPGGGGRSPRAVTAYASAPPACRPRAGRDGCAPIPPTCSAHRSTSGGPRSPSSRAAARPARR